MEPISTLHEYQYDSATGDLVIRDGTNCSCIGTTKIIENPELVETILLSRPIDVMLTQVYEYSYGDENKPKLIIPEKIQHNSDHIIITFSKKLTKIRVNIMYVCGYEYVSLVDV
jgi:hypothetical protein